MVFKSLALLSLAVGSALGDGLNDRAVAAGKKYFGSATDNTELTDDAVMKLLANTSDFGQITPGNSQKWDTIEPTQGQFSYDKGDAIVDLAEKNGQLMRCHNLVWYSQLPSWVSNGGFDNATLIEIMKNHITNEVTHYKGKCYAWDVVNEPLDDSAEFRDSVFYKTIGEAYIPIAFEAAAAADPDVKLYLNDYNIETSGAKSTKTQEIVKMIQSYGAKIDGVGLQAHLIVGSVPSADDLAANLKAFTDLGVEVAYTELDIRTDTPASDAKLQQQATDYASVTGACKQTEDCVGITIWDFTDKYSWVPDTFPGTGAALPWDEDLNKKPAYDAILNAWGTEAASNTSSGTASSSSAAAVAPVSSSAAVSTFATSFVPVSSFAASSSVSAPVAAVATPSTAPSAAVGSSAGTVGKYGQCGGKAFTGSTSCTSGLTCKKYNDFYSQCA